MLSFYEAESYTVCFRMMNHRFPKTVVGRCENNTVLELAIGFSLMFRKFRLYWPYKMIHRVEQREQREFPRAFPKQTRDVYEAISLEWLNTVK